MSVDHDIFLGAPPTVSKRNHFRSIGEIVEAWFFCFDTRGWAPEAADGLRIALHGFAEFVVRELSWAFKTATERGIEQAVGIVMDPDFYTATKKRRDSERKTDLKKRLEERKERQRKEMSPATPEEINRKIQNLEQMAAYYQKQADQYRKEAEEFKKDPARAFDLAGSSSRRM